MIEERLLSLWPVEGRGQVVGNVELLDQPLTAFFASRQCPGTAIRAAMTWAVEQARSKNPVISGFHSPLEQSVLEVLLAAGAPCVIVIARKLEPAHLPPAWSKGLLAGTISVVSMENSTRRLTTEIAARRNEWVVAHASRIVVAYASPEGDLQRQINIWNRRKQVVDYLAQ